MEIKHNTPAHLNVEESLQIKFLLSFHERETGSLKLFMRTGYTRLSVPTGFGYISMLQLLRPPVLLQRDCWRKPDIDPMRHW